MSNSRKRTSLVSIFILSLFAAFIFGSQPAMASYEINLAIGWNLVSLPEQPTNTDIAEVTSSIHGKYESIWTYVNGSWKVYDPNNPGFSDLTTMEAGPGYWVNMSETGTLSGSGSSPPECISLNAGWNLVGYNCEVSQAITDALNSIAGKYVSVWAYVNGGWKVYDPSNPGFSDLTTMEPGFGYWINATEAAQLCFTCIPPESLSIVITNPTGEPFYVTDSSTVILGGLTGGSVTNITWSSDQGGSGSATGTSEWITPSISLVEGDNVITCTAHSVTETADAVVTVTYNTILAFNSDLYIDDDVLYLNEVKEIIFRIGVDPNVDLTNIDVRLHQVDSSGNKITEIGSLLDNGNLANGDEIDQDGIFSGKFSLNESEEGMIFFRVFATLSGSPNEAASGVKRIIVVPRLMPEEIDDAVSNADNAKAKFEELLGVANVKGKAEIAAEEDAIEQTVTWLNQQPGIAKAGVAEGGGGFWFVNSSGILGGHVYTREGDKSGRGANRSHSDTKSKNTARLSDMELYPIQQQLKTTTIMAENGSDDEVGNSRAVYIGPYLAQFGNGDDYYGAWVQIKDSKCPTFDMTELKDNSVTIDTFKNLYEYGAVVISSHGNNWYKGLWSWWADVFGSKKPAADLNWIQKKLSQPVIASGVKLTKDTDGNWVYGVYENDLKAGRLAISSGGTLYITPGFINFYNKIFPNSIVYMSICRGFYNSALADAFIAKGAGVFFGFSDYVSTGYAKPVGNTVFEEMLDNGKTFKEAYDEAVKKHGASELTNNPNDKWPAYVKYKGKDDLVFSSSFKNGSFESGNLTSWEKSGDGRVIAKLGAASPTDGSYMAIISTGLGYTTEHGEISQNFCVANNATTLTFDWNFFSEEFLEWCGSIYQDWFTVTITDVEAGASTIIITRKVDDLCGSVTPVDNSFDQGGVYATGWQSLAPFDLTPYRGKAVKLTFGCNDVGDSIYDSAILVDKIVIDTE